MNENSLLYNRDYYEDGRKKGISGYQDYSWMPTRSISEAISIAEKIEFHSVLDFGAAKGFLVHALCLLGKEAMGADISEYAVSNCLPQVRDRMHLINVEKSINLSNLVMAASENVDLVIENIDLIIAKDVLEHLTEEEITQWLKIFFIKCRTIFIVVPLGDNDLFRIREYEIDKTHVTRKDEEWWIGKVKEAGFTIKTFGYEFGNVKANWKHQEFGNGFIVAVKSSWPFS